MRIGITGARGFIGWHLRCYLHGRGDVSMVRLADRETFADPVRLQNFTQDLDLIIHLAGVNRADERALYEENIHLAESLVQALDASGATPRVTYASSTQAVAPQSAYGRGKAEAGARLIDWGRRSGAPVIELIIPHVFGEHGRPDYNSAVATFCHQVACGQPPTVTGDTLLTLVPAQDLVEQIIDLHLQGASGRIAIEGHPIRVGEVAQRLQAMHAEYIGQGVIPNLADPFDRALFNALRAALPAPARLFTAAPREDARGRLVEAVKVHSGGQCFFSVTHPGVTRGNHYHRRKVERFFVLQGQARIRLRRLYTDEVLTYDLDGKTPACVDMPTLHTHDITNTGRGELLTLFWADEIFDPAHPDTFAEDVEHG